MHSPHEKKSKSRGGPSSPDLEVKCLLPSILARLSKAGSLSFEIKEISGTLTNKKKGRIQVALGRTQYIGLNIYTQAIQNCTARAPGAVEAARGDGSAGQPGFIASRGKRRLPGAESGPRTGSRRSCRGGPRLPQAVRSGRRRPSALGARGGGRCRALLNRPRRFLLSSSSSEQSWLLGWLVCERGGWRDAGPAPGPAGAPGECRRARPGLSPAAAAAAAACGLRVLLEFGQRHDVHLPARAQLLGGLHVGLHLLQVLFKLGSPILEPGDDLSIGGAQLLRNLVMIGGGQVISGRESASPTHRSVIGEGCARLLSSLFGGLLLPKDGHPVTARGKRTEYSLAPGERRPHPGSYSSHLDPSGHQSAAVPFSD